MSNDYALRRDTRSDSPLNISLYHRQLTELDQALFAFLNGIYQIASSAPLTKTTTMIRSNLRPVRTVMQNVPRWAFHRSLMKKSNPWTFEPISDYNEGFPSLSKRLKELSDGFARLFWVWTLMNSTYSAACSLESTLIAYSWTQDVEKFPELGSATSHFMILSYECATLATELSHASQCYGQSFCPFAAESLGDLRRSRTFVERLNRESHCRLGSG